MKKYFIKNNPIIPYIMMNTQAQIQLDYYISKGCKVIEVGVPFSDPTADGPIIEEEGQRAIANGHSLITTLEFISTNKRIHPMISFVLMTYLNPIYHMGYENFFEINQADALIIPDLPFEAINQLLPLLKKHNVHWIPLIASNTPKERVLEIIAHATGFIYYMALKGITGNKRSSIEPLKDNLKWLISETSLPIAVGFGIQSKIQVDEFKNYCDGVIIGSHLIDLWNNNKFEALDTLFI